MTEYWKGRLSAAEKEVYERILQAIAAKAPEVNIPMRLLTAERLGTIFSAVLWDHPECYAIQPKIGRITGMWKSWSVPLQYWYTSKEIPSVDAAIAKAKERILALRGSPVEKLQQALRMLILECNYGSDPKDPTRNQNISSVFYQHVAQCSGFSAAVQFIMDLLGIWCMQVPGKIASPAVPGGEGPHMWNIVCLDGGYYHLDATVMCGSNLSKKEPLWYYGIGCSDAEVLTIGHVWDRSATPACLAKHPAFQNVPAPAGQASSQVGSQVGSQASGGLVFTRLFDARKCIASVLEQRKRQCDFTLEISQYPVEKLQKMVLNFFRELMDEKSIAADVQVISHGKHHAFTITYHA